MYKLDRGNGGGSAGDFYGLRYHGLSTTHLDSLAHYWNENRMWNGRDPSQEITFDGANWGSVEHFGDGIVTVAYFWMCPSTGASPTSPMGPSFTAGSWTR